MNEIGDFTFKKGNYYPFTVTLTNKATGDPISTTGKTFKLYVNPNKAPADRTADYFYLTGVNNPDPLTGKVTFSPTAENHSTVIKGYYEIEMSWVSGIRTIVDDYKYVVKL